MLISETQHFMKTHIKFIWYLNCKMNSNSFLYWMLNMVKKLDIPLHGKENVIAVIDSDYF